MPDGQTFEVFDVLLPLALILFLSKLLSIGARKIGLPQVIGMLLTGVLLGCIVFIPGQSIINESSQFGIKQLAEIGVILIMFSAGMETNLKQIKQTGFAASIITILGVVVPMAFGFCASLILGGDLSDTRVLFRNIFYGVILTATSVSVTITTLKELGKLNSKIGTAIVSAAILDDIIGVIILSVIISLDGALTGQTNGSGSVTMDVILVFARTIAFFVLAIALGLGFRYIFKKLADKYDHHRRIPIFAMALAFFYAYAAEAWFGIADITGAFFAGLILSDLKETHYIERRADITSYLLFTPVFFAKVGLTSMSSFTDGNNQFTLQFVLFGIVFIIAGMAGKVLGCGFGAKVCKFDIKDSIRCGMGMMCRAEVCLICAQQGIDAGIISASIQPFILVLILITSFVTPVVLKATYKKELEDGSSLLQNTTMIENQTSNNEQIEIQESYSGVSMDQVQK